MKISNVIQPSLPDSTGAKLDNFYLTKKIEKSKKKLKKLKKSVYGLGGQTNMSGELGTGDASGDGGTGGDGAAGGE